MFSTLYVSEYMKNFQNIIYVWHIFNVDSSVHLPNFINVLCLSAILKLTAAIVA